MLAQHSSDCKMTLILMENEKVEFFKLDSIDQEVLLWTITHAPKSVKSWIEYISADYWKRRHILISVNKLFEEIEEGTNPEIKALTNRTSQK